MSFSANLLLINTPVPCNSYLSNDVFPRNLKLHSSHFRGISPPVFISFRICYLSINFRHLHPVQASGLILMRLSVTFIGFYLPPDAFSYDYY